MVNINIQKPVQDALMLLSEQQRDVIIDRFSLNGQKKKSLQEIGDKYYLTRERIRQIQNLAFKELRGDKCIKILSKAIVELERALENCGNIADEKSLCNLCKISSKKEEGYIKLLLEIGEGFNKQKETKDLNAFWYTDVSKKKRTEQALKNVQKHVENNDEKVYVYKDILSILEQNMPKNSKYNEVILTLLPKVKGNNFGEWGYSKNQQIALKSISGYIVTILRDGGKPLHFEDIAKRIGKIQNKKVNVGSCHNELVKNKQFILVGRGIYALEEMGYIPGTIKDVIIEHLSKKGSKSKDDIVKYVLNQRLVSDNSIVQTLNREPCFICDKEGNYSLV